MSPIAVYLTLGLVVFLALSVMVAAVIALIRAEAAVPLEPFDDPPDLWPSDLLEQISEDRFNSNPLPDLRSLRNGGPN